MALTFVPTNSVISSELATAGFVPDLWVDEIMAAHKKNLVLATKVRKINVKGKRGDSVVLPKPARGSASAKTAENAVTLIQETGNSITINLTAHWEYSRLIEDIAEVHALASMRRWYTDDAGYSLARAKDSVIFAAARTLNGGNGSDDWTGAVIGSDGSTAFTDASDNSAPITDAGIRRVIQTLDDNDIPMNDRFLVVPPVARRVMMGIARFSEQAFTGNGQAVLKAGKLGEVYGVDVHVSSNCPSPDTSTTVKIGLLAHKDALVLADVLAARVQTQYKQEFLATLLTADTIFGVAEAYDKGGVPIAMPG
jgi:hypothetical protein